MLHFPEKVKADGMCSPPVDRRMEKNEKKFAESREKGGVSG